MKIEKFKNKIIRGDALNVMREIPSNSIDMAFADPPFNLKKKYGNYIDKKEFTEYLLWCYAWLDEMVRVVKPTGSIFVHNIPKWLIYYATHLNERSYFKHWIAWDAGGAPMGKTLLPNHYGILFFTKEQKGFKFFDLRAPHKVCRECNAFQKDYGGKKASMHKFGTLLTDVWADIHRIRHKKRRDEHPCQLPVPLLERLILMTTDIGDVIIDPFIGTGTSAIAAKRLGRNYVGIDIDRNYTKLASDKLKRVNPTRIGNHYVSIYLDKILTIRDVDYEEMKEALAASVFKDDYMITVSKRQLSLIGADI